MSIKQGIWVRHADAADEWFSDECILNANPDGSLGFINPLLRRAQAAEAEVERLTELMQGCLVYIRSRRRRDGSTAFPFKVLAQLDKTLDKALLKSEGES